MRNLCEAAQRGIQSELPEMPKAQKTREVPMAAFLIERRGKVLVKKRGQEEKWLKGMWEFPSAQGKTPAEARKKLEKELGARSEKRPYQEIRHQITHHKIHLKLFKASLESPLKTTADLKWTTPEALDKLPFSSAQSKLRQWVLKHRPQNS
jgi:adenine-specific DNA glycosylase